MAGSDNTEKCIYIALNEQLLAEEISSQLACFGYRAHTFSSAETCREALLLSEPSALLIDTDFTSPSTGIHLVEEHHKCARIENILFLTNTNALTTHLACIRAGGKGFISAPFDSGLILEKIEAMFVTKEQSPYRVLIVEDSRAQAYFIATTLENAGMQTAVVSDPLALNKTLIEYQPELILMDIYLPKCSGVELAQVIRQQEAYVSVPIVFLSQEQDIAEQIKAMIPGGDDFLTKPITPDHLISAIHYRAERSRVLRSHMIKDSLTGLLNHTSLLSHLEIEVIRAKRHASSLSFVMLDIDKFKNINDQFGHPIGDRVIKSLSHLLQHRLRKTDIVGRYGGEEFALILPNTDLEQAIMIIEEVRTTFSELRQYSAETSFQVTFSAGVVEYMLPLSAQHLTEVADKCLYQAKKQGRNQIVGQLLESPCETSETAY